MNPRLQDEPAHTGGSREHWRGSDIYITTVKGTELPLDQEYYLWATKVIIII